jgi:hypothetical protein
MQLSGTNLMDLGNFGSNLAADTYGQRLGQFQGLNQLGMQGMGQGIQGLGQIGQMNMGYDQLLNQANYQGIGGQTDALGALAQANSASAIGKMNAQAQQNSSIFGALGTLGGFALGGPMGAAAGSALFGGGGGAAPAPSGGMYNPSAFPMGGM